MRRTDRLWTALDQSQNTTGIASPTTTTCQKYPATRAWPSEKRDGLRRTGPDVAVVTAQGSFCQQRSSAMRPGKARFICCTKWTFVQRMFHAPAAAEVFAAH